MNNESPNIEMHYSHLYFKDENRKLLKYGFCPPKSLYIEIELKIEHYRRCSNWEDYSYNSLEDDSGLWNNISDCK